MKFYVRTDTTELLTDVHPGDILSVNRLGKELRMVVESVSPGIDEQGFIILFEGSWLTDAL